MSFSLPNLLGIVSGALGGTPVTTATGSTPAATPGGLSTSTLLLIGAVVAGVVLIVAVGHKK